MTHATPLEGVKVLDLSRVLAGPIAGRMLADLGADVVKIEPPDLDVTRNWGRKVGTISGYFHQQNAGKRDISIDLKHPEGAQLVKALVKEADILLENFRPGVMKKLGLDWETLKTINPGLIMLSISGFGQTGPEATRAAYAPIVHAETGSIERQSKKSGGIPVEMCMSFADTNAGLHGLVGVLAALHMKQRTGIGQHIDIAMVDAMCATDDQTHYYLERAKNIDNNASEVWDATGGPIIIAGDFRHIWKMLTTRAGLIDPTPEGASLEDKIAIRRQALADYLVSFADRESLGKVLDKVNLAWGGVYNSNTFLADSPTLSHRNSVVEIDDRQGGTRPTFQSPYRFSDAESGVKRGAPNLGEHNQEVLSEWLGMEETEITRLQGNSVLIAGNETD